MTQQIPSRPPYRDDEYPRHTSEREGDGWAPVYVLRHDHPSPTDIPEADPPVGEVLDVVPGALVRRPLSVTRRSSSQAGVAAYHGHGRAVDFPMTPEQKAAAEEYAQAVMAGEGLRYLDEHMSDADKALLAAADRAERPRRGESFTYDPDDPPEYVLPLRHRATPAVEDSPAASALLDRVAAVAAEQTAVAHEQESAIAAFDRGEGSGVAIGLRKAAQRAERFKGLAVEKGDVDTAAVLDEFIRELVEVANHG